MAQLFAMQADIFRTLADANRLLILHELRAGQLPVGELVSRLGLHQSTISHHLSVLRDRSIVLTRRDGTTIYYRLADGRIAAACDLVRDVLRVGLARRQGPERHLSLPHTYESRAKRRPGVRAPDWSGPKELYGRSQNRAAFLPCECLWTARGF